MNALTLKFHSLILIVPALFLNGFLWMWTCNYFPEGETVILHYNTAIGIDFTGESSQIITLPLIGSILLIFNLVLGIIMFRHESQTAWTFWGIIPVIQIILIGAFYLIWRINI